MNFFKQQPDDLIDILNQQLWLNKYICINNEHIYYKTYENKGIKQLKDLDKNCELLDHSTVNQRYKLKTSLRTQEKTINYIQKTT